MMGNGEWKTIPEWAAGAICPKGAMPSACGEPEKSRVRDKLTGILFKNVLDRAYNEKG